MKITVLYLGKSGGSCIYTYEMIKGLLERGVEVQAILSNLVENKQDFDSLKKNKNFELKFVSTYKTSVGFIFKSCNIFKFLEIAKWINSFSPNWIYLPMISIWAAFVIPFVSKGIKIVTTIHDVSMHLGEENTIIEKLNDYVIRESNKIITLSERFVLSISKKYNFDLEKICWIRHGNYNYYKPASFKREYLIYRKFLFFGRIHEYKGISVLLDAMEILKSTQENLQLRIVGKGSFTEHDRLKLNQIKDRVEVVNEYIPNDQVFKFFSDVDFVVVPYIEASQSGVVMLAYAFALPVIVSDVGGLSEQVFEDTGYVIPAGNAKVLAEKITMMYENPEKILSMGQCAYNKNETIFSWKNSVKKLLEFLEEE